MVGRQREPADDQLLDERPRHWGIVVQRSTPISQAPAEVGEDFVGVQRGGRTPGSAREEFTSLRLSGLHGLNQRGHMATSSNRLSQPRQFAFERCKLLSEITAFDRLRQPPDRAPHCRLKDLRMQQGSFELGQHFVVGALH